MMLLVDFLLHQQQINHMSQHMLLKQQHLQQELQVKVQELKLKDLELNQL
jgi:hypothetical protein